MKTGSALLAQLERCGLAAKLADKHAEAGDDEKGARAIKTEIARAYAVNTHASLPEAEQALQWLVSQGGVILSVGETLDLIDETTGEVLVTGRPGAVLVDPALVVSWIVGDVYGMEEPEDDLGLVAMGLAAAGGKSFRVAQVTLKDGEVYARRSNPFDPETHAALWTRIRAAVSRPRIACPGDWCGACKQNVYCDAWRARAHTALTVFSADMRIGSDIKPPQLEITNENAGALMARIQAVEKAAELAKEQLKTHVRRGGRCVVNGKEYYLGQREGKKTADVAALEAAGLTQYIKQGQPYEMPGWRKVQAARPGAKR
jgi:hypothetical protein